MELLKLNLTDIKTGYLTDIYKTNIELNNFKDDINPIFVCLLNNEYYVVDGLKRLANCNNKKQEYIYALVLNKLENQSEQVKQWININQKNRIINELEKSFITDFLELSTNIKEDYKKYKNLPINIKNIIAINNTPRNTVRVLFVYPENLLNSLNYFIKNYNLNNGTFKNIVELSLDLFLKNNKNIFEDETFLKIANKTSIKDAIDILRQYRFPNLTNKKNKLNELVKNLNFKYIECIYDENLENSFIDLKIKIKNIDDIKKLEADLNTKIDINKTNKLSELIELYING